MASVHPRSPSTTETFPPAATPKGEEASTVRDDRERLKRLAVPRASSAGLPPFEKRGTLSFPARRGRRRFADKSNNLASLFGLHHSDFLASVFRFTNAACLRDPAFFDGQVYPARVLLKVGPWSTVRYGPTDRRAHRH
jgi:hypothetical protein